MLTSLRTIALMVLLCVFGTTYAQQSDAFITTWETTSSDESITIPTEDDGYDYNIYWENVDDEETNGELSNQTGDATITFDEPGTYRISISGDFPRIYFQGSGPDNRKKLLTIEQWGDIEWESMAGAFRGCVNMTITADDTPDLSNVTDMSGMFNNATSFNQNINDWDVSSVTDMPGMFYKAETFNQNINDWDVSNVTDMLGMFSNATSFNQNIGGWDVRNVTEMRTMLDNSNLSTENYDQTLKGWAQQEVQKYVSLGASELTYCNAKEDRQLLIDEHGWNISGDGIADVCNTFDGQPFTMKWNTTGNDETITIPIKEGKDYDYFVYWESESDPEVKGSLNGDGEVTITFDEPGNYNVEIYGKFPHIYFKDSDAANREKLLTIEQWGDIEWESMAGAFRGCENITITANDTPDLSNVSDMSGMFREAGSFNQDISNWDVGNVTNMSALFRGASSFNQDISDWNVSSVTNMSDMFRLAISFDADISPWYVRNVTNMSGMFHGATSFNQPIGEWDIRNVTDMSGILSHTNLSTENYDQTLKGWTQLEVKENISLGTEGLTYCDEEDRQLLIDEYGWSFEGDEKADNCTVTSTTATEEQAVTICPNPVSDQLFIEMPQSAQLNIITHSGQQVYASSASGESEVIDVSSFAPGVYLIKIQDKQTTTTHRFVKE